MSQLDKEYFENFTNPIRKNVERWLLSQFGKKCAEYEYGCECCERWKLADELFAYDRVGVPETLEQEIKALEECIAWRRQLISEHGDKKC